MGHFPFQQVLHVSHLNSFLELGDGNLTAKNRKIQMPGGLPGGGGMLMLQIDRCTNYLRYATSSINLAAWYFMVNMTAVTLLYIPVRNSKNIQLIASKMEATTCKSLKGFP